MRRAKEVAAVGIICALTIVGLVCATVGISILPKCRYGAPECYFIVEACAYDADPTESIGSSLEGGAEQAKTQSCQRVAKSRAIEGSSSGAAEQLAIPITAVATSCIPAVVTFFTVLFCPNFLSLLEFAKYWLAGSLVFLVLGIRVIQDLTFDCRWWGNQHHENGKACHEGLNLYVASSLLLLLGQAMLLIVSVRFVESRRWELMKDL